MSLIQLTPEMKAQFYEDAYLHIRQALFSDKDFLNLKRYLMAFSQAVPEKFRYGNFADIPLLKPRFSDWAGSPPLMNLAEQFLGPDIALWSVGLCYKPPNSKYRVVAHCDSHFWIEWKILEPMEVLGFFIPMTEMTKETGCLRVLPKRNEARLYRHKPVERDMNFFSREIDDPELDLSQMVDIEMKANEVLLTRENLVHSSECNAGSLPRLGLTIRYISTRSKRTPHASDARKIYLLKGVDHAGNDYADLSKEPPVGGFSWSQSE